MQQEEIYVWQDRKSNTTQFPITVVGFSFASIMSATYIKSFYSVIRKVGIATDYEFLIKPFMADSLHHLSLYSDLALIEWGFKQDL